MGKRKDLNDFEKGQIVMARRLGQSISQTAGLVGCSRYAVVSTYQKWSKEGQPVNRRQGHGRPRLIDARGERRLARLVRSHRRATVAQIAEKVNAGFDRKVSEHTVHRSLLRMGLRNRRSGRKRALEEEEDPGQERVSEPSGQDWSGERTEEEEDQVEEEHHYYQPRNLEPDGGTNTQQEQNEEATHTDQLQEVQERIEAMGLFLPQPPAPDSDEEEDPEGAAACRSHTSIPTDPDHVELVKRTMAAVNLPSLGIPAWARALSDDQWKDMLQKTLQSRQSSAGLLLQPK